MKSNRRQFIQAAGTAGAALLTLRTASADDTAPPAANRTATVDKAPFSTELFLDNQLLEATPGVSRKLHPAKKHLLNPVIRPERWCEGTYLEPYTTMYDAEEKLFKMWARAGSDAKAGYVGGNAAWMLYFTSKDGVHWEKPDLGVCDVGGRRDHNIVFASDMIPKAQAKLAYGPEKFVVPSRPAAPQGKKAFFWGVRHWSGESAHVEQAALTLELKRQGRQRACTLLFWNSTFPRCLTRAIPHSHNVPACQRTFVPKQRESGQ